MRRWIRAFRAPFFTASIVPVLLGAAVAYARTGTVRLADLLLTLSGVVALHAGTNLANDYFDHLSGNDWVNRNHGPFNGGSRVIQEGLIRPGSILIASLCCFALGCAIGLYLNWKLPGNVVLFLGLIGVISGFFYTAAPIRFGYRGIGEPLVGLNFGVLVVLGSYYVQTGRLAWEPVIASIPVSLLIAAVLWVNELPDYEADAAVGKRTMVVRLGVRRASYVYAVLLTLPYLWLAIPFKLNPWAALPILTAPLAIRSIGVVLRARGLSWRELAPANAGTVALHLAFGLALTAAYTLDRWL
ncbi:1,4-dihydroxy-2-naphthoate octaprenyltransferase [Candidatus Poribacteria bacterium]|nr:MAG: 1,4-dihydroxy-2-naphthoate octaprenyltransferase [Candidatus Poribacteria bacterium]